ncbi:MAG TPA: YceI family protein [Vicinamibacteria bacterium]|nr:YceI family protein [Vicinamibacteria bacterium]
MRWPSIILIMLLAGSLHAEPRHYVIDPQHLTIGFLVGHVGFAKVFGRFTEAEGTFDFDETTGKLSNVRVVVKTASVDTTVEPRDRHLRSADFLNVEEYPEMTFVSEGTVLTGGKGELRGNLTLIGVTRPISLDVAWNRSAVSPLPGNPYVVGLSARGSFDRSDYGMSYGLADGLVGDEVELIIELEAQRK